MPPHERLTNTVSKVKQTLGQEWTKSIAVNNKPCVQSVNLQVRTSVVSLPRKVKSIGAKKMFAKFYILVVYVKLLRGY